jgi:hypothetical protein
MADWLLLQTAGVIQNKIFEESAGFDYNAETNQEDRNDASFLV